MRVLHIVAERAGSEDSLAAAESLIASMASLDHRIEVAEVQLHDGVARGEGAGDASPVPTGTGPSTDVAASVLAEVMAADLLVLTVPGTGEVPEAVRWLADVLRGPQARMLRAADRRSGHRVTRRLVVVAARSGPRAGHRGGSAAEPQLGGLLALLRNAFRSADVGEVGLITGERAIGTGPVPPAAPVRSGARAWTGRTASWDRPAAS